MVGNTDTIKHYIFKGVKVVIINVISDSGQKLPYVLPTLSVICLHIVWYNNTTSCNKACQLFKL